MKMPQYLILCLAVCLVWSCQEEEAYDFGQRATGNFAFVVADTNALAVQFIPQEVDTSQVLVAWDFGFEGAGNTAVVPEAVTVFPGPGTYTVNMVLTNDAGVTSVKKEIDL